MSDEIAKNAIQHNALKNILQQESSNELANGSENKCSNENEYDDRNEIDNKNENENKIENENENKNENENDEISSLTSKDQEKYKIRITLLFVWGTYRMLVLTMSCYCTFLHRRHLMVWAVFAPKVSTYV